MLIAENTSFSNSKSYFRFCKPENVYQFRGKGKEEYKVSIFSVNNMRIISFYGYN